MAPAPKVALLGATGETGRSIVQGLLEAGTFSIISLTRPSSVSKPANAALKEQGVEIREFDLNEPVEKLAAQLKDVDILISAIGPLAQESQILLATAAKAAGVKRFLPCAFIIVAPPDGVMDLRDEKEKVYNHIKRLYLPYTIIDVGFWYQLNIPKLPSGKTDFITKFPALEKITGTGDVPSAITDLRDIGRYVARIILDERTVNKYVLVYNETWTPNQIYDLFEELSGEKIPRVYLSEKQIRDELEAVKALADDKPVFARFMNISNQYKLSWGIRGDNTPEVARYLGYVTTKELYPDFEFRSFRGFVKELLEGKVKPVYEDLTFE